MFPKFYMVDKDQDRCELCLNENSNIMLIIESFTLNKKQKFYPLSGAAVHDECLREYPDLDEFIRFYFDRVNEVFYNSDWGLCPVGDEFEDAFDSQFCQADPPQYNTQEVLNRLHNQDCTIFTPHYFEEIYVNDELRKLVD